MTSRFTQQKPNPAIKKNAIRARHSAKNTKRAQSFVVALSMAATLFGWVLFSHQDAVIEANALSTDNTAAVVSVQQADDSTPTPIITTLQTSDASQATN